MDNTLQIRISADISALQSALTKAKNTIKSFESETAKESEKGNVGFKRKIGLIESLTNKAKALRTALSQATNEQQVERYNQELEQTSKELTRLNALGRSVTANLSGVGGGFSKVGGNIASTNSVALEFNRIIQDAPYALNNFGSVANNVQQGLGQLTAQFQKGIPKAEVYKSLIASFVSPMNLTLLAVSALTAAFTAYQMGSLDFIFGTEEAEESVESLNDRLKEYIDTLGAVETANLNANKAIASERVEVDALVGVIENENLSKEKRLLALNKLRDLYPGYLQGLSDETVLSQGLRDVYLEIADAIAKRATALALEDELVKLAKERLELNRKLISDEDNSFAIQKELLKAKAQVVREEELIAEGTVKGTKRLVEAKAEVEKLNELFNTANSLVDETGSGIVKNKEATTQLGHEYQNIYDDLLEINSLTKDWENATDDVKTKLSNIFSEKDMITQFEMIGKAISEGVITPDQGQLIKDNLAKALVLADNSALDKSIQESLKGSLERAASRFSSSEIIEFPVQLNIAPEGGDQELGIIERIKEQMASINLLRDVATDPTRIQMYNEQLGFLQEQLSGLMSSSSELDASNKLIIDSFSNLGIGIANSMNISNNAVRGFVSMVLSSVPKIIAAIMAQAAANRAAAEMQNQANLQQAVGNAVVIGTEGAKALGPFGIIALPLLIGGAVALVTSAMSKAKSGGGGGGGGIPMPSAPPQIFTNAQTVAPPSNQSPNYPRGNDIDFDKAQGRLFVDIEFDKLRFGLDMNAESKQSKG